MGLSSQDAVESGTTTPNRDQSQVLAERDRHRPVVGLAGVGAGTRAIQQLKQVVITVRMVPVFEAVNVPFAPTALDADGTARPDEDRRVAAVTLLDELSRVTALHRPTTGAYGFEMPTKDV